MKNGNPDESLSFSGLSPSHQIDSRERLAKIEEEVKHSAKKVDLEKAIGDMKVGIAEAIGDMRVGIAEAVGDMKTSVAQTKWEIIRWILGGTTTLIGLSLFAYKLFFSNLPT